MSLKDIRIGFIKQLIDINENIFFIRKMKAFYKSKRNINTIIDVGANKGQSIEFFLAINPKCQIFAIEPNPTLYSLLKKKYAKYNNIQLFNLGISDKSGEKLFFENVLDYTSTFETLNMNSEYLKKKAKVLGVEKDSIVKKSYYVSAVTLSEFIKINNLPPSIDVLKIDTEGHEYYCLLGLFSEPLSTQIKYIQLENHSDDMYANRINFSELNNLLNKNYFYECAKIKHGFGNFDEVVYSTNPL